MSNMDQQESNQAVPFFARYLEGQIDFIEEISEAETQSVTGGKGTRKKPTRIKSSVCGGVKPVTKPSGKEDVITTKKYPSDQEDVSGGSDVVTTLKFPSDQEDVSGGSDVVTTLKFPSDQEDVSGAKL